jgi:hypothetical protein
LNAIIPRFTTNAAAANAIEAREAASSTHLDLVVVP